MQQMCSRFKNFFPIINRTMVVVVERARGKDIIVVLETNAATQQVLHVHASSSLKELETTLLSILISFATTKDSCLKLS